MRPRCSCAMVMGLDYRQSSLRTAMASNSLLGYVGKQNFCNFHHRPNSSRRPVVSLFFSPSSALPRKTKQADTQALTHSAKQLEMIPLSAMQSLLCYYSCVLEEVE